MPSHAHFDSKRWWIPENHSHYWWNAPFLIPDMFVSGKSQQIYVDLHLGRASEIALVLGVSQHFDAMVGLPSQMGWENSVPLKYQSFGDSFLVKWGVSLLDILQLVGYKCFIFFGRAKTCGSPNWLDHMLPIEELPDRRWSAWMKG